MSSSYKSLCRSEDSAIDLCLKTDLKFPNKRFFQHAVLLSIPKTEETREEESNSAIYFTTSRTTLKLNVLQLTLHAVKLLHAIFRLFVTNTACHMKENQLCMKKNDLKSHESFGPRPSNNAWVQVVSLIHLKMMRADVQVTKIVTQPNSKCNRISRTLMIDRCESVRAS